MLRKLAPRLWILVIAAALLVLQARAGLLTQVEASALDASVARLHGVAPWPPELVVVAVDQEAITALSADGNFPLGRDQLAQIWERLRALGVVTIVSDAKLVTVNAPVDGAVEASLSGVILPVTFERSTAPWAAEVLREHALWSGRRAPRDAELPVANLMPPLVRFASNASLGHTIGLNDPDGVRRRHYPIVGAGGEGVIPSAPLVALLAHRGLEPGDVSWDDEKLRIEGIGEMPLHHGGLFMELSSSATDPPTYAVLDVLDTAKTAELRPQLEGKVVVLYMDSVGDRKITPLRGRAAVPGGLMLAHGYRVLASGHAPRMAALGAVFLPLLALALIVAGPAMRAAPRTIAACTASAAVIYAATQALLFDRFDVYVPLIVPVLLVVSSGGALFVIASWRLLARVERAEARADAKHAPRGQIALVFTDVQGSTKLWEGIPEAMREALALHDALLRSLLAEAKGYEVKTEGDAFMIAFASPLSAAAWCLAVQEKLLMLDWPEILLAMPDGADVPPLWRGLCVRMGIHVGTPEPREDPRTGRMDYFGPDVNKAARVAGAAQGGQIVLSGDAWARIEPLLASLPDCATRDLGMHFLKGMLAEMRLVEMLPKKLADRARSFGGPITEPTTGPQKTMGLD